MATSKETSEARNNTPTPLTLNPDDVTIRTADGARIIATLVFKNATAPMSKITHAEAIANAAFIVRAVNSHDALVKALETAKAHDDDLNRREVPPIGDDYNDIMAIVFQAIRQIQEG